MESDHRPLQAIFIKPLLQAPMTLQRLLLAIQKYDLTVQYKPGKLMFVADTLSRSFLDETKEELVPDLEVNSVFLNSHLPVSPFANFSCKPQITLICSCYRKPFSQDGPKTRNTNRQTYIRIGTFVTKSYVTMVCCSKGTNSLFRNRCSKKCLT